MRKFISLLLIALFSIIGYAQKADSYYESVSTYQSSTNNVKVRSTPSTDGSIIARLQEKQSVEVTTIENGWAKVHFVNESGISIDGYVKEEFLKPIIVETQESSNKVMKYSIIALCCFSLICYIIALIRTNQRKMITIVNWYDFALLTVPFLLWIIGFICLNYEENVIAIILFVVGGLSVIGSMIWSILANKGNVFNIIVAVFAKLFVISIVWIALVYIFRGRTTTKSVTYSDGSKGERRLYQWEQEAEDARHRKNSELAIVIVGVLILSLIASIDHKAVTEQLKSKI